MLVNLTICYTCLIAPFSKEDMMSVLLGAFRTWIASLTSTTSLQKMTYSDEIGIMNLFLKHGRIFLSYTDCRLNEIDVEKNGHDENLKQSVELVFYSISVKK